MSELLEHSQKRKELLKHMIRQLHEGSAPDAVKRQLAQLLGKIPYDDVVRVEQELISEGMPVEEIIRLCDIHSRALKGQIDQSGVRAVPAGHPAHTFREENQGLSWEVSEIRKLHERIRSLAEQDPAGDLVLELRSHFNALADVEKHYRRKENLLFPFLEKHGVTGPPKVMWGKHDEVRTLLKNVRESLATGESLAAGEAQGLIDLVLEPAVAAVDEMIFKEEEILLPMCLDTLSEEEWYQIYRQSDEIGYCLYDPTVKWNPEGMAAAAEAQAQQERIQLPSGSFTAEELDVILNSIPFDLTFVDKDDTVRYFTQGRERIFARNRAILGRQVQLCHPPKSVHIVEQILADFKAGKHDRAAFWIEMHGRFISIEYFALRSPEGKYLGVLEVSQDLTEKRKLQGEQRLLNYGD